MNRIEWKRIVCALLAIILLMSYVPATASAASYSGNCGPYATWSFDSSTGVLTISGEYQISDYDDEPGSPWYVQGIEDSITAVVINEGITKIGAYAFDSASNIVSVTLPKSLTTIKEGAFRYCESLTSVTFKGDCPTIQAPTFIPAAGAFHEVTATMYYPVGNTTYTTSTKQNYGGTLTWVAYNPCANGHAYDANNICTNCGYIELVGNGTCGTDITWTLDVNGTLTISGSGYVTSNPWDKKSVRTVVLESGIVHAGDMSFTDCTNLTDLYYGGTATQWNNFCLVFQNEPYIHLSSTDYLNHWEASTVSATCTDAGYTCEACSCGHERNKQTTQAALDHSWSDWSISNDATCTADGTKIRSCQRTGCNATETETIPSTGDNHSYSGDVCTGCGAVKISQITFPDEIFRAFLSEQSYGNDGLLTAAELSGITSLDVAYMDISNLTGIEYFTALEKLHCGNNQLTSLDVSNNTALTYLDCQFNQLTNLDVSNNTSLTYLYCYENQLTSLDVSKNTALVDLSCQGNKLTNLDVSKNTALVDLYCCYNQLTSLDVSNNTALTWLSCYNNQLTSLDVSNNTALTDLDCQFNQLTSLDISSCISLRDLRCCSNWLKSLDVSKSTALTWLECNSNQLTSLDVSKNTALTQLDCSQNSRRVSASQNKVDLSGLEADGFDISKASGWTGGTVSGNILTATSDTVTYTYDLGNGETATFTLTIDGFCTHSWNAATCTVPKTCTGCGATEGEALGHSHKPTVTDPTCTEKGYTTYTCHCGDSYVDPESYTAALEHLWSDWVVTKPNCITDGTKTRSCQREGCEAIENETLPAIGSHSFDAKDICSVCHAIKISEITFPDDNFRAFIIAQGYTADDVLTPTQIGYITSLNISDKKIKDLTGIEYFTALTSLDCSSNPLTTFDLSKNSALTELICRNISLTSLDVSKNAALEYLDCSENLLTSLDLSKNVALENLYCSNNLLTSLTLANTALTVLNCEYNLLTSLDVSQCTALEDLYCYDNQLTSLDLSNHPDLATVSCQNNQLTSLDVSKSASLTNVYCYSNQLKSLDLSISTTLKDVQCYDNQLTSLVLGNHPALTTLLCYNNQLTSLDISSCISLRNLQCYSNRLKSLDVSKSTALTELDCRSNQLTSLTLGANTALKSLSCAYNKLTGLDLSKCTALRKLYCHENQLTSLDLSKCTALTELECNANNLKQLNISTCTALTSVGCSDNQLTRLDVSNCTALTNLLCNHNQLTSLDLSKNVALTGLVCYSNKRTVSATQNKIDLSALEADGFDVSKASNWKGGTVSGNILTVTSDTVTYTYDLGRSKSETFTLLVDGLCAHSWNAATCTDPKTCKECGATEGTELGHQMSDWEVTLEPTLTEDGEMKRACQRQGCDHVETDIVSKLLVDSLAAPVAKTSNDTVTGKVKITWAKVTGALEYEISRATAKDGTYTALATTAETAFIDTSAEPGTLYYYKVRAINSVSSVVSDYSAIVSRTCDLAQPVVTASNVASSGKIKLTWEKVDGVTEYKVYRATSKSGEYKLMKTTTGTSYTNTSAKTGSTYYYKVKAIHSNSSANSVYSEIVSRACDLPQPTVKATNVASSGKVKLTWSKVEGAKEYKVYRATTEDGEYKLMKTTTGTSYTNTSADAGNTYYYKVKAIHSKSSANSAYSEVVTRTCDLARPVVTIKLKNGDPRLTWEKVAGATEYQVYRATSKNGEYKLMKTTTGTSYTNTSAKSGKTYYYKVKAIHSNSVANSAYSSVDSIKAK